MATYEAELSAAGLTDWAGVLEVAASAAGGSGPNRLIGLPTLLLDVAISNEAELDFVRAVAANASDFLATLPAADEATTARMVRGLSAEIENIDLTAAEGGVICKGASLASPYPPPRSRATMAICVIGDQASAVACSRSGSSVTGQRRSRSHTIVP